MTVRIANEGLVPLGIVRVLIAQTTGQNDGDKLSGFGILECSSLAKLIRFRNLLAFVVIGRRNTRSVGVGRLNDIAETVVT